MTTPSASESRGLVVEVWKSSIVASGSNVVYTPEGQLVTTIAVSGEFSFTLEANGGYWSFSTTLSDSQVNVEEWLMEGLQYNIVVYSEAKERIWEGFVNSISAQVGGLSVQRGPLLGIGNRVSCTYARQAVVGYEVVTTSGLTTVIADNDVSKLKYGIFEKIANAGTVWDNSVAEDIRDTWLNERSEPETTKSFATGGGGAPSVAIECLGWIHFLGNYIYNANDPTLAPALNTSCTISDKIVYVIDGDPLYLPTDNGEPNGLFDAAGGDIDMTNGMLVSRWEDQNTDAWSIIKDLVSAGDIGGNRYLFGLYANRKIVYKAMPSTVEYVQRLSDPGQAIMTEGEEVVFPWSVLPGNWMLFTDFLIGKTQPTDLRLDQRALFIERVAYSTPRGLQLDGGKVHTIDQKLAQRGLGLATA